MVGPAGARVTPSPSGRTVAGSRSARRSRTRSASVGRARLPAARSRSGRGRRSSRRPSRRARRCANPRRRACRGADAQASSDLEIDVRCRLAVGDLVGRDDDRERLSQAGRGEGRGDDLGMGGRRDGDRPVAMRSDGRPRRRRRCRGRLRARSAPTTPSTIARSMSASGRSRSSRSRMIRAHAAEFAPMTAAWSSAVQRRPCSAANRTRTSSHQISESTSTPSRSKMTASISVRPPSAEAAAGRACRAAWPWPARDRRLTRPAAVRSYRRPRRTGS